MSDDRMFLAHRPTGLAIFAAKMFANSWRTSNFSRALEMLQTYLENATDEETHEAWWRYYTREPTDSVVEPFVLLFEGMSPKSGFGVSWTTPSGYLSDPSDYVTDHIFRVIFL